MSYLTTRDNTSLYYKDWGQGRLVVLIHGWPLSSDSWDDVALQLADNGFRVIAYDRRGFGRSDQPWTGYDYDTLSDDLADVLAHVGAEDAVLVGFSMGGGEVARYMSRHGGKGVAKAVLVGSVVPYLLKTEDHPEGVDASVFEGIKDGIKEDRAKFFASFFKDFYGLGLISHPVSSEVVEWTRGLALQAGLKPTLDCVTAFSSTDFRPDLASFRVPTLIIHGEDDRTVPIDITSVAAARAIPGSELIRYEGAPHGLCASHKERLVRDLIPFLRV